MENNENILIKLDQNNLLHIDPNSVTENGVVKPRYVKQEDLMMFVNLEADLVPRSNLIFNSEGTKLTNISSGVFNLQKPNTDDGFFGTQWTDSHYDFTKSKDEDIFVQNDSTGRSFGIESINISIKGNFVPVITINFVDVRGKTLFESSENSPYQAFFHLPWPIFYLTVKGYYGKAVRYRLHMSNFTSKFDSDTGNFNCTGSFIGSTFAFLNDIPFKAVMNSPYMFINEHSEPETTNTKTGKIEQKIVKQTRGYNILKSVYSEMKGKKIIPNDFPVKTIKELITISESIDKILERKIFKEVVDTRILGGLKDYEESINFFIAQLNSWGNNFLNTKNTIRENNTYYYPTNDKGGFIKGNVNGSLEYIINNNNEILKKSLLFNNEIQKDKKVKFNGSLLGNGSINLNSFVITKEKIDYVAFEKIITETEKIKSSFETQKVLVEKQVEEKMNEILVSSDGIGFKPTIKNIFTIILANAEVFIRLMKNTHEQAFSQSKKRKEVLSGLHNDSIGDTVFPWPEVTKTVLNHKGKEIVYPGSPELRKELNSDDPFIWPEVNFIEEFVSVSTNKSDSLTEKESGVNNITYLYGADNRDRVSNSLPVDSYYDKTITPFLYELYERSRVLNITNNFSKNILTDLVNVEYDNIYNSINEDNDIIGVVKTLFMSVDPKLDNMSLVNKLKYMLKAYSPYERSPYMSDDLFTVNYIKESNEKPFNVNVNSDLKLFNEKYYNKINTEVKKYKSSEDIDVRYPFSSDYYKKLVQNGGNSIGKSFSIKNGNDFLSTDKNNGTWVKQNTEFFREKIKIGSDKLNLLNTSVFHNQLFNDFNKNTSRGKYVGSAYLFLNTLPFKDLNDTVTMNGNSTPMYKLFNDLSSVHYIPYLLLVKWGSIYHRHKKMLNNGIDIVTVTQNDKFKQVNYNVLFDNEMNITFTNGIDQFNSNDDLNVGTHPFYDSVFHQIINGYGHYDVLTGNSTYSVNTNNGSIVTTNEKKGSQIKYWTNYVDNEKYESGSKFYTLLPSNGGNSLTNKDGNGNFVNESFTLSKNNNFKIIWEDEKNTENLTDKDFVKYNEYFVNTDGNLEFGDNKKIVDLISVFGHRVLSYFEEMFISFSNDKDVNYGNEFQNLKYNNFQLLLKELVTVDKSGVDNINTIKEKQRVKLSEITNEINREDFLVRVELFNPKEYDVNTLKKIIEKNKFETFNGSNPTEDKKLMELYLGEDIDNFYYNFFIQMNIKIDTENLVRLKPLIYVYSGLKKNDVNLPTNVFKDYVKNILSGSWGFDERFDYYLTMLLEKLNNLKLKSEVKTVNFVDGYNNENFKIDLYNLFKTFNDKWVSGNSIPNRLLIEDFLFLDKANKDIGNDLYLNLSRLVDFKKNDNLQLYGALNILIEDTGIDMRTLPSYINFYGDFIKAENILSSNNVANDLFGVFGEVDYIDSHPKTILQYVGNESSKLGDMGSKFLFKDDSMNITKLNNNPLIITTLENYNKEKLINSNRVVSFEIGFGDQNQNIFKSISLDQATFKNTAESMVAMEEIARSETGSGTRNVDIGLMSLYNKMSYTCGVSSMCNMVIQPTMYFYLKNVPMFRGTYRIIDVEHSINSDGGETSFTGVRVSNTSLPDPKDSFMSSYKSLFDKIIKKTRITNTETTNTTEKSFTKDNKTYVSDPGTIMFRGENDVPEVGITNYGVSYNGYNDEKYIQKIYYDVNKTEYLRTNVVRLDSDKYPISDKSGVGLINMLPETTNVYSSNGEHGLKWGELKKRSKTDMFYYLNITGKEPEEIVQYKTEFLNPKNGKRVTVEPNYNLDRRNGELKTFGVANNTFKMDGFGIGLSEQLCRTLEIKNGDVVYFNHL